MLLSRAALYEDYTRKLGLPLAKCDEVHAAKASLELKLALWESRRDAQQLRASLAVESLAARE